MSKITSIATRVPAFKYRQAELLQFADQIFSRHTEDSRKLSFLYKQSGIETRYSVSSDFNSAVEGRSFFPSNEEFEPVPSVEARMKLFAETAGPLSVAAIEACIDGKISKEDITHLITVSCTGVCAPGLDLHIMEEMGLPNHISRTSVNFMGCYAAVHALKMADAFCAVDPNAKIIIVCTELCTIHFQKENSIDNITASLLFADGSAAMLIEGSARKAKGIRLESFFSDVSFKGKNEMAWSVSSKGFLMTLTGYVPGLIKEDFKGLMTRALTNAGLTIDDVTHWCIHPGGKQILQSISSCLDLPTDKLDCSYEVLRDFGNMSSATIVFVLEKILTSLQRGTSTTSARIFGAAFGPGLTMETFTAVYD